MMILTGSEGLGHSASMVIDSFIDESVCTTSQPLFFLIESIPIIWKSLNTSINGSQDLVLNTLLYRTK